MFRFNPSRITLVEILSNSSYPSAGLGVAALSGRRQPKTPCPRNKTRVIVHKYMKPGCVHLRRLQKKKCLLQAMQETKSFTSKATALCAQSDGQEVHSFFGSSTTYSLASFCLVQGD